MHPAKILLAVLFLSFGTYAFSQTLKYDVMLFGKKIGEATVERLDSAGFKHYRLRSHSDAKIIGIEKKDDMSTEALFDKDGKLLSSDFSNQKNKEHLITKTRWKNNKLNIEKDGAGSAIEQAAEISSLTLYLLEPKGNEKFYSERLGKFFDINKEGEDKYKVAFGDYTAIYTYQSGRVAQLEMKEAGSEVVMKLVE